MDLSLHPMNFSDLRKAMELSTKLVHLSNLLDGVLHYIIDVQGTLVRRRVDQIRLVGDQVQGTIIPIIHQRFPSAGVRENNSDIQHAETAEDISKYPNKELDSSSVEGVPSTDVAVPDL
ncbi:uncharacterized protein K02A2.6 [Trichonephila clavata]|uniref:Uncharacterized protein K02A2.6 n=1 Tax=Trichonephila clavata TaxID=2740835 RepID=A0A8X6GK34_TRICU|nr:uncharacterized protein K02A2.6 [Trichonephila clavata]